MSEGRPREGSPAARPPVAGALRELAILFLRLGTTAFGGPAAHIALMEQEVVRRRRWLTHEQFLDLLGAVNLIPGPNATEMAIHIGLLRGGRRGLILAGTCFILPAMVIVLVLAWAYARYGSPPETVWLLSGVKPVIIAIVVQAVWALGIKAVNGAATRAVGAAVLALSFLGVNEILLLFAAGIAVMVVANLPRLGARGGRGAGVAVPLLAGVPGAVWPPSGSSFPPSCSWPPAIP